MSTLNKERMIAELEDEFLIFIVELQVHKLWQFRRWYPAVQGMNQMLSELIRDKEYGLLSFEYRFSFRRQLFIMYWRSFEHMHDWALNKNATHIAGWKMLNQLMKAHPEVMGFWHESYVVRPNEYESFYRNVPSVGLGLAGTLVPIRGRASTAAQRLRAARAEAATATAVAHTA